MKVTQIVVQERGAHETVSVWVDGKLAGALVVGAQSVTILTCWVAEH